MKEELKKLLEKINKGVDFSIKELSDVDKQILRWGIWQNVLEIIAGFIVLIPGKILIKIGLLWERPTDYYSDGLNWYMLAGIIIAVIGSIIIWVGIYWLARVLIAPKTYLISRMRSLVKGE